MRPFAICLFLFGILLQPACTTYKPPDLGQLYNESAQAHGPERNPVILIPGILGSRLKMADREELLWGAFTPGGISPRSGEGARALAMPMQVGTPLQELRDDVYADGALDRFRISLLGVPLELNAYVEILAALGAGGYADRDLGLAGAVDYGDDHYTCFQFAYDWRRSNDENARELHRFILEQRDYVQEQYEARYGLKNYPVKFDIVAHSMGGLITRYYLRYGEQLLPEDGSLPKLNWAGRELVDKAVIIATPNAGTLEAVETLRNGAGIPPISPKYEPAIVGTYPSIYQLLPRVRHRMIAAEGTNVPLDLHEPAVWQELKWGLSDPQQDDVLKLLLPKAKSTAERAEIAQEHQRKCLDQARQFAAALDMPVKNHPRGSLHLFAGDAVETPSLMMVNISEGGIRHADSDPGDGAVLRASALADERITGKYQTGAKLISPIPWDTVTFLFDSHLGMTKNPNFSDNLLFLLLESRDPASRD